MLKEVATVKYITNQKQMKIFFYKKFRYENQ